MALGEAVEQVWHNVSALDRPSSSRMRLGPTSKFTGAWTIVRGFDIEPESHLSDSLLSGSDPFYSPQLLSPKLMCLLSEP